MSSIQSSQPQSHAESKTAKKKKAKAEAPAQTPAIVPDPGAAGGQTASDGATNGPDGNYESPYLKELHKYGILGGNVINEVWLTQTHHLGTSVTLGRSW